MIESKALDLTIIGLSFLVCGVLVAVAEVKFFKDKGERKVIAWIKWSLYTGAFLTTLVFPLTIIVVAVLSYISRENEDSENEEEEPEQKEDDDKTTSKEINWKVVLAVVALVLEFVR